MGNRRVFAAPEKAAQQELPPRRQGNATIDPLSVDRLCEAVIESVQGTGAWMRLDALERHAAREAIDAATIDVAQSAYEQVTGHVLYRVKVEP